MATFRDRAGEALTAAERTLRQILADATAAGDYNSVVEIAAWARDVAHMRASEQTTPGGASAAQTSAKPEQATRLRRSQGVPASSRYPRFHRQSDRLVRVAWSKKERKEYEHKAPLSLLGTLASRMIEVGADGRVFSTDELLPIVHDGAEVPSYQAYVGIAFLRQAGLIDQHGRRGYSIPRIGQLQGSLGSLLESLPRK